MMSYYIINVVSICNVYHMYVIFVIWQCPDILVIGIHAFLIIHLNVKMSNDILTFRCIIRNAGGKNENILAFLSLLDKTYAG